MRNIIARLRGGFAIRIAFEGGLWVVTGPGGSWTSYTHWDDALEDVKREIKHAVEET